MAGTSVLSKALDIKELNSLSVAVKKKLEVAFGSEATAHQEISSKYEKLRVDTGKDSFSGISSLD